MTHGELFKELREWKGFTQAELAKMIGCKQQNISQYESDRCLPRGKRLKLFCKALNIKVIKRVTTIQASESHSCQEQESPALS